MSPRIPISIRRPEEVPEGTPMAVSLRSTRELTTGTWRTFRPTYVTVPSPCNLNCPAGTDVRAFLAFAGQADSLSAWRTILEHNPLPGICGRVCYHPCETGCNRSGLDERVAIHGIERAAADEAARLHAGHSIVENAARPNGTRVAVVGAGPAGLACAYHLQRRGHRAFVFDAAREPGGMLRYGIPAYRLPREVLDDEIALLRAMGIEFRAGARLGTSLTWKDLQAFDAVFIGVGTQRSRAARVPGEDLAHVKPALDFLRLANAGEPVCVSRDVLVIGGGNTAMDAARVALRHGARVTVAYRRARKDMPAHPDEITHAAAEGVEFLFNVMPVAFHGSGGAVRNVTLQRTRPGPPDASGRCSPEPIPGSIFTRTATEVLTALGEELEQENFAGFIDVLRGHLKADRWGHTGDRSLFAGGDAATGAGTVVEAIGSGRRAAEGIDAWFAGRELHGPGPAQPAVDVNGLNLFYFPAAARQRPAVRDLPAPDGLDEVVGGLSWKQAAEEARRCFSCGLCTSCNNCVVFCPESAAAHSGSAYEIDLLHCKGCGLCVAECPRGAMALVPEEAR